MRPYPVPPLPWLEEKNLLEDRDREDLLALLRNIENDDKFTQVLYGDGGHGAGTAQKRHLDSAFYILMIYLRQEWNNVDRPLLALETLVTDFRNAEAIWCGNGNLPQEVAGLSSLEDAGSQRSSFVLGLIDQCILSLKQRRDSRGLLKS
jgi:hypothetical protein